MGLCVVRELPWQIWTTLSHESNKNGWYRRKHNKTNLIKTVLIKTWILCYIQQCCWFYGTGNILKWTRMPLQWRHNGHDGVSNNQLRDCLLNRLFRRKSKKTSKLRVTGLCAGNSPGTGEFPAQMAKDAECVSIWWRHHESSAYGMWQYEPIDSLSVKGYSLWGHAHQASEWSVFFYKYSVRCTVYIVIPTWKTCTYQPDPFGVIGLYYSYRYPRKLVYRVINKQNKACVLSRRTGDTCTRVLFWCLFSISFWDELHDNTPASARTICNVTPLIILYI